MIKFITDFFRVIFIIILFLIFMVKAFFFINVHIHEIYYPDLGGYSYYKVDENNINKDYEENDYLFTKYDDIKVNDNIIYLNEKDIKVLKIKSIVEDKYIYLEDNYEKEISIDDSNIKGKVFYTNKTVSKILCILTNPIVILLMILYVIFIKQFTFKRFEL